MLGLPLTSVLLTTLFLASDGFAVMPLVIVAVVVTYVARAHLPSGPRPKTQTASAAVADARPSGPGGGRRSAHSRRRWVGRIRSSNVTRSR